MKHCEYQFCEENAEYIDDMDNYVCGMCMERSLSENEFPEQTADDFEKLNWNKFPENGYCR